MSKKIICNVYPLMIKKGIKSVTELQKITGLARRTLDKAVNNVSNQISHNTAIKLCEALDCNLNDLYSIVDEKTYKEKMAQVEEYKRYLANGFVYFIKKGSLTKIGKTNDLKSRLMNLRAVYGKDIKLIHYIKSADSIKLEKHFHTVFSHKRVQGEWFSLTDSDLKIILKKEKSQGD